MGLERSLTSDKVSPPPLPQVPSRELQRAASTASLLSASPRPPPTCPMRFRSARVAWWCHRADSGPKLRPGTLQVAWAMPVGHGAWWPCSVLLRGAHSASRCQGQHPHAPPLPWGLLPVHLMGLSPLARPLVTGRGTTEQLIREPTTGTRPGAEAGVCARARACVWGGSARTLAVSWAGSAAATVLIRRAQGKHTRSLPLGSPSTAAQMRQYQLEARDDSG